MLRFKFNQNPTTDEEIYIFDGVIPSSNVNVIFIAKQMEICCFKFNENHFTDIYRILIFRGEGRGAPFSKVNLIFIGKHMEICCFKFN